MSLIGSLAAKIAARFDDRAPVFYAADMVTFALRGGVWHVLVIQRGGNPHKGKLALPGGHVDPGETAREAAVRELAEETGVTVPAGTAVHQVGVFDAPGRAARGRYVTVAYAALLPDEAPTPVAADDAAAADWMPLRVAVRVARAGGFAFDHDRILSAAIVLFDLRRTLGTELGLWEES
ncbi:MULTISPECIES: NUDIX hydrolase [unclassified Amycolatopsis]|uniref:NUDIX hydrolase n=1 Tax=unclassified Amycolatopsis TaxID=2618356 RepID=UPI002E267CB8|nr:MULTISPECIES: NUDIX hydrolase [unclassified Amycolatopsis]